MESTMLDVRALLGATALLLSLTACEAQTAACTCTGNVGDTPVDMLCGSSRCIDGVSYTCADRDRVVAGEACATPETDAGVPILDGAIVDGDGGTEPAVTAAYVIASMDIPVPVEDTAVGVDLDGMTSAGATKACDDALDYTSSLNGPGVDNQFGPLAAAYGGSSEGGVAGAFAAEIAAGNFLLVVELQDVNDFVSDDSITARFFFGAPIGALTLAGGRVAPGQGFTVVTELGTVAGRIFDGQLVTEAIDLPLELVVDGATSELPIRDAVFTAMVTASSLTQGEIGGAILVDDLVAAMVAAGFPADRAFVEAATPPDIHLTAAGSCDAVSVGLSFDAVEARTPATDR